MKCKHLALLLLASNFLLTSLPALAELEDAPLPGDFQSAQPAKQAKPPSPAPTPPPSAEKPQGKAAPTIAPRSEPSRKQAVSRSKPPRKATVSIKGRRKAPKVKQHTVVARRVGVASVKAGNMKASKKRAHSTIRKNGPAKYVKKPQATLRTKAKPAKTTMPVIKKPLKIKKKKAIPQKVKK